MAAAYQPVSHSAATPAAAVHQHPLMNDPPANRWHMLQRPEAP